MRRQPEPEYMDLAEEAEAYAVADFDDVNGAFVERLVELANGAMQTWAVDLGTGPADIPRRVAEARPGWRIAAADASFAMLRFGSGACAGLPVLRVQSDAKRLPFPDNAFQVVFSNSILHHMPDPLPLWEEIRRIASPGAVLLLRDLARPESASAALAIVQEYASGESALLREEFLRSLLAAFTPDEVRDQLAHAGLEGLHVAQVTDRHLDVYGRIG